LILFILYSASPRCHC